MHSAWDILQSIVSHTCNYFLLGLMSLPLFSVTIFTKHLTWKILWCVYGSILYGVTEPLQHFFAYPGIEISKVRWPQSYPREMPQYQAPSQSIVSLYPGLYSDVPHTSRQIRPPLWWTGWVVRYASIGPACAQPHSLLLGVITFLVGHLLFFPLQAVRKCPFSFPDIRIHFWTCYPDHNM